MFLSIIYLCIYYKNRVRFMHSLVMMILFDNNSIKYKMQKILENTFDHARKLGGLVFLYKLIVCFLTKMTKKYNPYYSFIGGLISFYVFFRKKTSINT